MASTLMTALIAAPALANFHAVAPLSVTATIALTLLLRTLLAGIGGLLAVLGLLRTLPLAAVPSMAAALAVLPPAVAALFLLLLPLRRGFLAGYQLNKLS
jgi:hypothetical protein